MSGGTPLVIADAVTTMAVPVLDRAIADVSKWASASGVLPAFDLEIWAAAAVNLTAAKLYGLVLVAGPIVADAVDTTDFANDELDVTAHALNTGDGPVQLTTSNTLPTGLALATDYWIIEKTTGTVKLALSLADALAGTAVAFSDVGVGTHTLTGASASRVRYIDFGFLGGASDGAISLTADIGYGARVAHKSNVIGYAVGATLSTTVATTVTATRVQDR